MTLLAPADDLTVDAFLSGRVRAFQPASGHHRSGLEAVLLAAALDSGTVGTVIDLGAGAGIAGMCAAARCPAIDVTLVERDPRLADCARRSLAAGANSAFADRVRIAEIDLTASEQSRIASGLGRGEASAVLVNPPFYNAGSVRASPSGARAAAHVLDAGLDSWFRAAAWSLRPNGVVIVVSRAAAVAELLTALGRRFGSACLLPLHSRPNKPADRLLLRAVKGSRAAPAILPGLTLHEPAGSGFSQALEAILRDGAGLGEVHHPWQAACRDPS